jgi:hypothetical protein
MPKFTELNKTDCYPKEIIDQRLSHAYIVRYGIDNDINLQNNQSPIIPFFMSEIFPLSTTIFKGYIREMSEIKIITDNDLLFSNYEEKKSFKFMQKREETDLRKEHGNVKECFSQMNFFANTKTEVYIRRYTKLFEVIGKIGGFSNGIIFTAYIILYIYSKNLILWNCISVLISSKEINQNIGIIEKNSNNRELIISKIFNRGNQRDNRQIMENSEANNINANQPSNLHSNNNNNTNNLR